MLIIKRMISKKKKNPDPSLPTQEKKNKTAMSWDAIKEKSSLAPMSTQLVTPPARTDFWKSARRVVERSTAGKPWHFSAAGGTGMNTNTNTSEGVLYCTVLYRPGGQRPRSLRVHIVHCNIPHNFYLMGHITIKFWSAYETAVLLRELYRLKVHRVIPISYGSAGSQQEDQVPTFQTHRTHFRYR